MSQINTKTITFKDKDYEIKYCLSEEEYFQFVASMMISIFPKELNDDDLPVSISQDLIFDKAILQYYVGLTDEEVNSILYDFDSNNKCLYDIVKDNIWDHQYKRLELATNRLVQDTINRQFYQENITTLLDSKINQIMDKLLEFSDNLPKWSKKLSKLLNSKDISKLIEALIPTLVKSGILKNNTNKQE